MVLTNEATKIIVQKIPNLKKTSDWNYYEENTQWDDYMLERCSKESLDFTKLMHVLTDYVASMLQNDREEKEEKELKEIFLLIEHLVEKGDKSVKSATTTNFLENLINISSHGDFEPSTFIHYLGPKSKAYCKAWDEFTGVKTPGLWDE